MRGKSLVGVRIVSNIRILLILGISISLPWISRDLMAQEPFGAVGQSGFASDVKPSDPPSAAPAKTFTLADFAWLSGRWLGKWGPRVAEQVWTPARAGMMLGAFRIVESDKTLVIELLALTETTNGIDYRIRHFTPDLAPWEKSGSRVLHLVSMDGKRIVFENPIDGQPKHSILDRIDDDTFVLRSEIVPAQSDPQVVEITFHRQKAVTKKP